ncbi:MAG: hypothetical protein DRI84_09250 [Bacteroidetes bacterium]|nr:MAG: hypothetical protein DRI84_09250 [Bacteroidota bacterium]
MKRIIGILIFVFAFGFNAMATHQRAAEITYKHLTGLSYEFTITMYTLTSSVADDARPFMPIFWGDNSGDELKRIYFEPIPDVDNMTLNIYKGQHTFPGPGSYRITVEDPNRNSGVINIPRSIDVPMFIETELIINPFIGNNNSVQLLNPPIDLGCVGKLFIHNPAAYDVDGDSLSYKLVKCKGAGGFDIPGYTYPMASDTFKINSFTGDIIWKNPVVQGEYNIAFVVEEWRSGFKVGSVRRDMQVIITSCSHEPPEIIAIDDTCILAGDYLQFEVKAYDPEGGYLTLEAFGGPFEQSQNAAFIIPDPAYGKDTISTTFNWPTSCSHIRNEPYSAIFKATDNDNEVDLVNFKNVNIKVIAPAPENLHAEAMGNGINLSWEKSLCENAVGYKIYRRNGESGWEHDYCEVGVPPYTGFRLIKEINNINTTNLRDDNSGNGLMHGTNYCYRVTASFYDEAESYASNESCATLKRDVPIITHVSNDSLDLISGNIELIWAKPTELDMDQYPGPYKYIIYRNNGLNWSNPIKIAEKDGLNDTIYHDAEININENDQAYTYLVDLESTTIGYIGSSQRASSIYLNTSARDKEIFLTWNVIVPWNNYKVAIFRKNPGETTFDFIGITEQLSYRDKNLENDEEYCYYIKIFGEYSINGIIKPLINFSQISCEKPNDNMPPCKPEIKVYTDCEQINNEIRMWLPYDSCSYDAMRYFIYYKPPGSSEEILVDSIDYIVDDTAYYLHTDLESIVGCYSVSVRDTVGNISEHSNIKCVDYDACPIYEIPNVFTPNSDGFNDLLIPMGYDNGNPKANVDRIEMTIFNRWGKTMFYTENPLIEWDGKNQNNNQYCVDGVYYYVCEVYFISLDGVQNFTLKCSVSIIRGGGK